jgi:hypothetical protein
MVSKQYRGGSGAMCIAVYNLPISKMMNPAARAAHGLNRVLPILIFSAGLSGQALDWSKAEQQFAKQIAAVTGPGAVAVRQENRSSLSKKDADAANSRLQADLEALGVRAVTPEQAAATVAVSLSENPTSYVWVAEIHLGAAESSVVMVSFLRAGGPAFSHESFPITLRKIPLWSQEDRILDVAVLEEDPPPNPAPKHIAVLDAERVSVYRLQGGKWQREQALNISSAGPWPRDLRGRLIAGKDHLFDVYLPGVLCHTSAALPLTLSCRQSDDPWPLVGRPVDPEAGTSTDSSFLGISKSTLSVGSPVNAFFASTRNFFTGALSPGIGKFTTIPKFYSAAFLPRNKYMLGVFAAVDGQIHLVDGVTDQAASLGWGSDVASVRTTCGIGWQVLATSSGNNPGDSVRAYELADRDPVPVSMAADFAGEITALWTEIKGDTAVAVARNQRTGDYEAFRLAATCNQ